MKKYLFLSALIFIISITIIKSMICPTDYRDSYVGSYFCNSKCNIHMNDTVKSDTLTLVISKDQSDSIISIKEGANFYKVKLKDTILYAYPEGMHFGGHFYSSDSISFSLNRGIGKFCNYRGKKN